MGERLAEFCFMCFEVEGQILTLKPVLIYKTFRDFVNL